MEKEQKTVAIIGANSILSQAIYSQLKDDYQIYQVFNENKYRIKEQSNLIDHQTFLQKAISIDYIFFISAIIDYGETSEIIRKIFETNVYFLKSISEKHPEAKIIHASSVSLYKEGDSVINEHTEIDLASSYQMSKCWGENIVRQHPGGGVNIRLSSLFGPEMNIKTFLPYVIKSALINKKIILFGDGSRKQNYIDAAEAATYFCTAMHVDADFPLLAVNRNSCSNLEIAEKIQNAIGNVEIGFENEDNSPSFIYNNELSRNVLGLNSTANIDHQIQQTILWMQKQF